MSGASGIKAGDAYVRILTDNNPLSKGLDNASKMLAGWGQGLRSVGASIFAPLAAAGVGGLAGLTLIGEQLGEIGGQIDDMAQRTGMTTEAVSELGHAASMSGTDLATVESGLVKMQRLTAEAAAGSKSARAELRELGVTAADLAGMTPDKQLELFADKIAAIEDPAARTNAAMSIFGKAGQKMLKMVADGSEGIEQLRQEARDLGKSMGQDDAAAAADLGDAISNMKTAAAAAAFSVGTALAPALKVVFTAIAKSAGIVGNWIKQNRGIVMAAIVAAGALLGVGAAIYALGVAFTVLSMAASAAAALIGGLVAVFGFLISGPGLIVAGLVALTYWLVSTGRVGLSSLGWLSDAWKSFAGDATGAWSAIVDAIQAGDLQSAFAVGMAFVRLQSVKATGFLWDQWYNLQDLLARSFVDLGAGLEAAWVHATGFLLDAWTTFTSKFIQAWRSAQNFVGKGIAWIISQTSGLDPNEVWAEMDADLGRRNAGSQANTDAVLADRDRVRQQRLAEIEQRRLETRGNVGSSRGGSEALTRAQEEFAAALEAAKRTPAADTPTAAAAVDTPALAAGAERAQRVAADATDIRSEAGLKAVLSSLYGKADPQEQVAAHTKLLAENSTKQLDETRRLRRASEEPEDTISLDEA